MTSSAEQSIVDGLLSAMKAEHEGFHFYKMAAQNTQDQKGREVFLQLADDEKEHLAFLKAQWVAMKENGIPDTALSLKESWEPKGASPIFSERIKHRIKDAHFEMTALSIGIQLELDAVKHYKQLADVTDEPFVKKFFEQLSEWESTHYQALLTQQSTLQEDYWTDNGFSPF